MRKLIYISLAALTLQTCAGVHAAGNPSAPSQVPVTPPVAQVIPGPAPAGAVQGTPVPAAPQMLKRGGSVSTTEQVGDVLTEASRGAHEAIVGGAKCQSYFAWSCGRKYTTALSAIQDCVNHPRAARKCFRNICAKLKQGEADFQRDGEMKNLDNKKYIEEVNAVLRQSWKDSNGNVRPVADAVGCKPAVIAH